jgi:hypothetical protein
MIRNLFLINLAELDALPRYERWYWRIHAPQAQRMLGPWLRRYESFRSLPPPPEAEQIGYYNYRMSDLWFDRLEPMGSPAGLIWLPDQARQSGLDSLDDAYGLGWAGLPGGAHPPLQLFLPAIPENDFKGKFETFEHTSYVRWIVAHKAPDRSDLEAAEDWFVNVHGPEASTCEELLRFFSCSSLAVPADVQAERSPDSSAAPPAWRYSEYWFETMSDWRRFFGRTNLTPPPGSEGDVLPFWLPYRDFVSTFCLERPDWTLVDIRPLP